MGYFGFYEVIVMYDIIYDFILNDLIANSSMTSLANSLSIITLILIYSCLVIFVVWLFKLFSGLLFRSVK